MTQEELMKVLLAPIVSEKSLNNADISRQFSFKVLNNATKTDIKNAVELMFNVKVEQVRVLNVKAKVKRFGQRIGKRKGWKKAYVALQKGYDIDYTTVAT